MNEKYVNAYLYLHYLHVFAVTKFTLVTYTQTHQIYARTQSY